jgi:hypothetical protein
LVARLRWLDENGDDIDHYRATLGSMPLAREWNFVTNSVTPRRVADNLSVPNEARAAAIFFSLEATLPAGKQHRGTVKAVIGENVALKAGQITSEGMDINSGPVGRRALVRTAVRISVHRQPNTERDIRRRRERTGRVEDRGGQCQWIRRLAPPLAPQKKGF